MHKQEELGQISDSTGERDQNTEGKSRAICELNGSIYVMRLEVSTTVAEALAVQQQPSEGHICDISLKEEFKMCWISWLGGGG